MSGNNAPSDWHPLSSAALGACPLCSLLPCSPCSLIVCLACWFRALLCAPSCNVTTDGLNAIMKLASGDMRRSLNVLQACHMAYDEINEVNVYSCTGNPLPSDLKLMLNMLNNMPIKQAYEGQ